MAAKFKLMWENSPDTPISAQALSEATTTKSELGGILYKDIPELLPNGVYTDNILKVRANSSILLKTYTTRAMFFNTPGTLVSHNSQYGPQEQENVVYLEQSTNNTNSIYVGEGTTNLLSNPGFEDDLTDWTYTTDNGAGYDPLFGEEYAADLELVEGYESAQAVRMTPGGYGNVEIRRTHDLTGIPTVSFSFYYKADGNLSVSLSSGGLFWKNNSWNATQNFYDLPATGGEWIRFEIKNITTAPIQGLGAVMTMVMQSDEPNKEYFLDSFQLEELAFVSPYVDGTRDDSLLKYTGNIINVNEGYIDITLYPRVIEDFTIFSVVTDTSYNAIELIYVESLDQFQLRVHDYSNPGTYVVASITAGLSNRIDKWTTIICGWDKDTGLKIITTETPTIINVSTTYTPHLQERVLTLDIASNRGLSIGNFFIDNIKINSKLKDPVDMIKDFELSFSQIDEDIHKVFNSGEEALHVTADLLDDGDAILADTDYNLWVVDDLNDDTCSVVLTEATSAIPQGVLYPELTTIFAGFRTDSSGEAIMSSLWDNTTHEDKRIHTQRLLINGTNTDDYGFDIRTQPYAEENDVRSTIPIHFSNNLYGRHVADTYNQGDQYLEANNEGWLAVDNIKIDENKISTRSYLSYNNDLELTVDGITSRIWLHSNTIDLDSGDGVIELDDLRLNTNTIYSMSGTHLIIDATTGHANNNLTLKGFNTTFTTNSSLTQFVNSDFDLTVGGDFNLTAGGTFSFDDIHINDNNIYTDALLEDLNIYSDDGSINIDSGTNGTIQLDDIIIKDNLIYRDSGDINIETPDNIYIGAIGEDADSVYIRSENFVVQSNSVVFENVDAADFITFDNLKIRGSEIYTEGSDNIYINSAGVITLNSASQIDFADTGGYFYSRVISTFTKDLNVKNVNFTDVHSGDLANIYTTINGTISILHIQAGVDAVDKVFIEHGTNAMLQVGENDVRVDQDLFVGGNLTVQGDTVTLNTTTLEVEDHQIMVNKDGSDASSQNAGIRVTRTIDSAGFYWDELNNRWVVDNATGGVDPRAILYDGYASLFPENINIVTSQPAGFKVENDEAVGGVELLDPDGIVPSATLGEAVMNVGLHMDYNSLGYIQKKIVSGSTEQPESVGAWMEIDTRVGSKAIYFKYREANETTVHTMGQFNRLNESTAQIASSSVDEGYFQTPWIKTNAIEASGEGDATSTGLFMGVGSALPDGTALVADQIVLATGGANRLEIRPDGDVEASGDIHANKVHNAVWGDIAECWPKEDGCEYEYEQVVVRTKNGIQPSKKRAEIGAFGIISNTYGYLLKSDEFDAKDFEGSKSLPIALKGTVHVKLYKSAKLHDELVAYKDGQVIKANWFEKIFMRSRILGVIDGWKNDRCIMRIY